MQAALQYAREHVGHDQELISLRDRAIDISRAADLLAEDSRIAMAYELARVELVLRSRVSRE